LPTPALTKLVHNVDRQAAALPTTSVSVLLSLRTRLLVVQLAAIQGGSKLNTPADNVQLLCKQLPDLKKYLKLPNPDTSPN